MVGQALAAFEPVVGAFPTTLGTVAFQWNHRPRPLPTTEDVGRIELVRAFRNHAQAAGRAEAIIGGLLAHALGDGPTAQWSRRVWTGTASCSGRRWSAGAKAPGGASWSVGTPPWRRRSPTSRASTPTHWTARGGRSCWPVLTQLTPVDAFFRWNPLLGRDGFAYRLLAALEVEVGAEAVRRFWTADGDLQEAFQGAFGVPMAEWTGAWIRSRAGTLRAGVTLTQEARTWGTLLVAAGLLLAILAQRRRVA